MLDLEPIREREAKASKGPWHSCRDGECSCRQIWSVPRDHPVAIVEHGEWGDGCRSADAPKKCIGFLDYGEIPEEMATANMLFIAHARTDIPALIAEVEAEREKVQLLRKAVQPVAWAPAYFDNAAEAVGRAPIPSYRLIAREALESTK